VGRALIAVPPAAVLIVLCGLGAVALGLLDWTGRLSRWVTRIWGRLFLAACGIRVRVSGLENLPDRPAVYAANHASAIDVPILFGHLPIDFRIVHKRSLYKTPFIGWGLYFGRHVAIERESPFRAKDALAKAAALVRRGASLVTFPEGTRSPDGRVRPFKRGSVLTALEAGAPVVPVSLVGVKRVVPRGFFSLRGGQVALRIHPPVSTAGHRAEDAKALAREVREIVVRGCEAGAA
jgi:1-acyl-sn-glycerol-3-phosphate acyltransferase